MDIPSGWSSFKLGEITYESRRRFSSNNSQELPVFRVNNETGLDTESKYHADSLDRYKIVDPGMFAYNPMRLNIGSIGYCTDSLGRGLVSPDYIVFGCKEKKLDSKFLSYCIQEHHWKSWVERAGAGSVRVRIYYKDILHYPIILPPLLEQRKIAQILSTWDEAIDRTEKLIAALEKRKKGLMQRLFTGQVRFPGFTDEWKKEKLGQIGNFTKGAGIKKFDVIDDGLACIRYGEIYTTYNYIIDDEFNSFISSETAKQSKRIHPGDILFAGSGETADEIGKSVAYIGEREAYAGGDIIILRLKKGNPRFFGYLLNDTSINRQKSKFGQGHSVVHIYARYLNDIVIPFPPVEEQKKIADVLEMADQEIKYFWKLETKLKQQKKGLMQRLLTGQVRIC
jgi:type I restriction enzyme S subunit